MFQLSGFYCNLCLNFRLSDLCVGFRIKEPFERNRLNTSSTAALVEAHIGTLPEPFKGCLLSNP